MSQNSIDTIVPGLDPAAAISMFERCCNTSSTLFITDWWFAPRKAQLLEFLTDPITVDEAEVLRGVIRQQISLEVAIHWISGERIPWAEYVERARLNAEKGRLSSIHTGFFPWEDVNACRKDDVLQQQHHQRMPEGPAFLVVGGGIPSSGEPCPLCNATFQELELFYFESPAWTWQKLCGRAGWMTICVGCNVQVQFFMTLMN